MLHRLGREFIRHGKLLTILTLGTSAVIFGLLFFDIVYKWLSIIGILLLLFLVLCFVLVVVETLFLQQKGQMEQMLKKQGLGNTSDIMKMAEQILGGGKLDIAKLKADLKAKQSNKM